MVLTCVRYILLDFMSGMRQVMLERQLKSLNRTNHSIDKNKIDFTIYIIYIIHTVTGSLSQFLSRVKWEAGALFNNSNAGAAPATVNELMVSLNTTV